MPTFTRPSAEQRTRMHPHAQGPHILWDVPSQQPHSTHLFPSDWTILFADGGEGQEGEDDDIIFRLPTTLQLHDLFDYPQNEDPVLPSTLQLESIPGLHFQCLHHRHSVITFTTFRALRVHLQDLHGIGPGMAPAAPPPANEPANDLDNNDADAGSYKILMATFYLAQVFFLIFFMMMCLHDYVAVLYTSYVARADTMKNCRLTYEANGCDNPSPFAAAACDAVRQCSSLRLPTITPQLVRFTGGISLLFIAGAAFVAYSISRRT